MRPRFGAAALAVLGGLLIVAAVFTPQWWAGPIQIAGRVIHGKTVHISMLRATGCNAGDGTCMSLDVDLLFRGVGILSLLVASLTAASSLALAARALRRRGDSTTYARLAIIGSVFAVVVGAIYLAILPERFEVIPLGVSPYGYFGGAAVVVLASVLALRGDPTQRVVADEPLDVRELLSTDMLRPANLGPEPKLGRHGPVLQDEPTSAVATATRFRPLYEVQGYAGAPGVVGAPGPVAMAPAAAAGAGYITHLPTTHPSPLTDSLLESQARRSYPEPQPPARPSQPARREQDIIETASLAPVTERADALPEDPADPLGQVDPPRVADVGRAPSDPGFDAATMPSQMSLAAMLERQATDGDPEFLEDEGEGERDDGEGEGEGEREGEREGEGERDSGHRASAVHPGDVVDSGVFLRQRARSPIARVPTATTSASLAALAALSKPALITMAPAVARKMASAKGAEGAVPSAAPAGPAPACPHCEAPMSWADRHHRYFCAACRVYF